MQTPVDQNGGGRGLEERGLVPDLPLRVADLLRLGYTSHSSSQRFPVKSLIVLADLLSNEGLTQWIEDHESEDPEDVTGEDADRRKLFLEPSVQAFVDWIKQNDAEEDDEDDEEEDDENGDEGGDSV